MVLNEQKSLKELVYLLILNKWKLSAKATWTPSAAKEMKIGIWKTWTPNAAKWMKMSSKACVASLKS
jgi:hypothetical protein